MKVLEKIVKFEDVYGKEIVVGQKTWRYYRLGRGTPILWLTGGLRRAAIGFSFMEMLSERYTIIAPDYPPVHHIEEFITAFDAILKKEKIGHLILAGQSYGGLLAQAYLVHRPQDIDLLVLSSSGPVDYGRTWLAADYFAMALVHLLPEKIIKKILAGGLLKSLPLPKGETVEWVTAIDHILQQELSRADVLSHFGVAADLIRKPLVRPKVLENWHGRVIVLSAANDPTQSSKDFPRYERLFGHPVEQVDMGEMGHGALMFDPRRYVDLLVKRMRK